MRRARFGRGFGPVVRQTTKLNVISALTTMRFSILAYKRLCQYVEYWQSMEYKCL